MFLKIKKQSSHLTLAQHRVLQWMGILIVVIGGGFWYYQTQVRGAATIDSNTPSFQADLTNTLDLQSGAGNPTFTRATTATFNDFEGIVRTVKSGEARFEGARRVENLLTYSEQINNGVWTKTRSSISAINTVVAPDGTMTAEKYIEDTSTNSHYLRTDFSIVLGSVYTLSYFVRAAERTRVSAFIVDGDSVTLLSSTTFDLSTGSVVSGSGSIQSYGNGWYRISITGTSTASGTAQTRLLLNDGTTTNYTGDGTSGIYIWGAQLENVAGQTTQTVGEYVSTNVLTSAPYHGANVDGVKYFTTKLDGTAIADTTLKGYLAEGSEANLVIYSDQFDNAAWSKQRVTVTPDSEISPDGTQNADLTTGDGTSGGAMGVYKTITASANTKYVLSYYLKAGTSTWAIIYGYDGTDAPGAWFDLVNGRTGSISGTGMSDATIQSVGNGWYRCSVSRTTGASATSLRTQVAHSTGDLVVAALSTFTLAVWGAQVELGSFPSTYIPTTATSVTRNEDALSYPTSGNVDGANGTIYSEIKWPFNIPHSATEGYGNNYGVELGGNKPVIRLYSGQLNVYDGTSGSPLAPFAINYIRNNMMVGAVAGTPGANPTNWTITGTANGLTKTIVGTGVEDGITYIDIKYSTGGGNTSGAGAIVTIGDLTTGVAATTGQTWTGSAYVKLQAGSLTNLTSIRSFLTERDSGGTALVSTQANFTPTSAALSTQRNILTRTLSDASTAYVSNTVFIASYASGVPIDFTLRIGMPQIEMGSSASSVIATRGTLVTAANTLYRAISSWNANDSSIRGSINGSSVGFGTFDGDMNIASSLHIGRYGSGGYNLNGTIRNVKIWKKALTDTQLTNLMSADSSVVASVVKQSTVVASAPSFQADLTHTLDLQKGAGSPTFTRATSATVTDFEGVIRPVKSGEARFEGARRVENLAPYSQNFENAAWAKTNVTVADTGIPTGLGMNYREVVSTVTGNSSAVFNTALTQTGATAISVFFKPEGNITGFTSIALGADIRVTIFPAINGWYGTVPATKSIEPIGDGYLIKYVIPNATGVTGLRFCLKKTGDTSTSTSTTLVTGDKAYFAFAQVENVTGQTTQTAGEYVSTNVLTSAPYHGANVDGVKYFTTKLDGTAIADTTLKGYLAEGSRTNVLTYSEEFSNANWNKNNISITDNSAVAPGGYTTADTLVESVATGNHNITEGFTPANATTYTFSVYLKAAGRNYAFIGFNSGSMATTFIAVNLSTGATSNATATPVAYGSTSMGNGWYRVWLSLTSTGTTISTGDIRTSVDGVWSNRSYTGDGVSGIYMWGAQLEAGAFPSSYIPTTTGSVTRNADALLYPSSGNAIPSQGSVSLELYSGYKDVSGFDVSLNLGDDASSTNAIIMTFNGNVGANQGRAYVGMNSNGVNYANMGTGSGTKLTTPAFLKEGAVWSSGTQKFFDSGVLRESGISASVPLSFAQINIGSKFNGSNQLYGSVKNIRIWKKALTDTQLTNLTSTNSSVAASAIAQTTVNVNQSTKMTEGLVGLWSFNGKDISGATTYDRSGSNNGTITGGVTPTTGKVGQALSFNGTTGYIAQGAGYNGVKTISFWMKPDTTTQSLIDLNGTQTVDISSGTVRANSFTSPTIYIDGTAKTTIPNTDWHFIAITTDTSINASAYNIGKIASAYYGGKLDEVRIYNTALTAAQVNQLYMLSRGPWLCGNDTVSDIDGNVYGTILIGTQCWMNQNLMTTRKPDGSAITRGPTTATWNGSDNGYYAYPPNTGNTDEETLVNIQANKLGFVYQWSAAMAGSTTEGAQGICPAGWHIPTDAEQNTLDQYLTDNGQTCDANRNGTYDCSSAGTKLKSGGSSGLDFQLTGYRYTDGSFNMRTGSTYIWSSLISGGSAWIRSVRSTNPTVYRGIISQAGAFSVRCLKD